MKKKQIANLIMVAIILLIATLGVLGVGYIRGWFDIASEDIARLSTLQGTVKELIEANEGVLPDWLDGLIRVAEKATVRVAKAR